MHLTHFTPFFHHPWGMHLGIIGGLAIAAFLFVAVVVTLVALVSANNK